MDDLKFFWVEGPDNWLSGKIFHLYHSNVLKGLVSNNSKNFIGPCSGSLFFKYATKTVEPDVGANQWEFGLLQLTGVVMMRDSKHRVVNKVNWL